MADQNARLEQIFQSFCSFGQKGEVNFMDGPKFNKFCRDCKVIDGTFFSATDADLIFSNIKVKPKAERRITFPQFLVALQLIADKKYKGDEAGMQKLANKVFASQGPSTSGTTAVEDDAILSKMTDEQLYTGAHKGRFDEMHDKKTEAPRPAAAAAAAPAAAKPAPKPSAAKPGDAKPKETKKKEGASIFDKLTDPSQYTGAHKERFNADGTGKGMAGRDSVAKGGVDGKDLSKLVARK